MITLQVFLYTFLLVKPSLQILADGSAVKGNALIQSTAAIQQTLFPTTDFSSKSAPENERNVQAQRSLESGARPDLYLPNFGPNGAGSLTTPRVEIGFQQRETHTPPTLLIQNPLLQSTTLKSPEKIDGIIELLKTFTGNTSIDGRNIKQNPEEIAKENFRDSKIGSISNLTEKQEDISHYLQEEKRNLLNAIHDAKIESEIKSASTNFQINSSSSSSFTTLSELTTESNAPLTTSTTLATTTATVDHVQKVLENQDLQHQLLEQLLAKEVQRGMQDGLLNIVAKLGVTDKIPDTSTTQHESIDQPLERSMNDQTFSDEAVNESYGENQKKKIQTSKKKSPLYEIPFYK